MCAQPHFGASAGRGRVAEHENLSAIARLALAHGAGDGLQRCADLDRAELPIRSGADGVAPICPDPFYLAVCFVFDTDRIAPWSRGVARFTHAWTEVSGAGPSPSWPALRRGEMHRRETSARNAEVLRAMGWGRTRRDVARVDDKFPIASSVRATCPVVRRLVQGLRNGSAIGGSRRRPYLVIQQEAQRGHHDRRFHFSRPARSLRRPGHCKTGGISARAAKASDAYGIAHKLPPERSH